MLLKVFIVLYLCCLVFAGVFVYTALKGYDNIVPSLAAVGFVTCFLLPIGLADRVESNV